MKTLLEARKENGDYQVLIASAEQLR